MKYHQFTPAPEALAARMLAQDVTPGTAPSLPDDLPGLAAEPGGPAAQEPPATLDGITALRDRAFVDAAYRLLLGREADPEGLAGFVHQLRSGARDKVDVLGDLRHSAEGQQRAVDIAGLGWRYALRRLGRRRGIGWLFRWLLAALRLPVLVQAAQRHQAQIEQASVVADDHAAAIQQIARELRHARALAVRLQTAESALGDLGANARAVSGRLSTIAREIGALRDDDALLRQAFAERYQALGQMFEERYQAIGRAFEERYQELDARHQDLVVRHQHLGAANGRMMQQLQDLTRAAAAAPLSTAAPATPAAASPASPDERGAPAAVDLDDWYLAFEDQFRGSREETKRAQEIYLDYVAAAGAGTVGAPIIDIGCGRGEWLELLQEHACVARGVDLNHTMVLENRQRGLDVAERDVLAYLAGVPDASVGMVSGFHIIEHLRFDLLVKLFDECRRVLKPGGCVLFETPNPENLVVGAYTFYFDPTHRHPLPPKMIEFVVRERGYADVEILRLHPRQEEGIDHALLDTWFRGPTDYAVIGWKDGRGAVSP